MAYRPRRPCKKNGCQELSYRTYCEKHQHEFKSEYEKLRGSATSRGYNYRWKIYRDNFLKSNPLCLDCLSSGIVAAAIVVDHIKPHKGNHALFWDISNHQALCVRCHNSKTAREDGGFGKGGGR